MYYRRITLKKERKKGKGKERRRNGIEKKNRQYRLPGARIAGFNMP